MQEVSTAPPLGEQVADALRQAILTGEMQGGTELRQSALAERFGVSRIPVREALQMLERDALVVVQPNRRVLVATLSDDDLDDHYSIRALVEGEAAFRAAERSPAGLQSILNAHAAANETPAADVQVFIEANERFHRSVWLASGSPRLQSLAGQLWTGIGPRTPALLPGQLQHSVKEHSAIVEAIQNNDPEAAKRAMARHIRRSCDDLKAFRKQD